MASVDENWRTSRDSDIDTKGLPRMLKIAVRGGAGLSTQRAALQVATAFRKALDAC